ncbi:U3 small nucleolar RNA-associated protein 6-domain-containing protein [Mycena galericulata]|nr:U3 small nucleolar RNA-associated protein 6-domain-containing protein [Mycena galericulata]
MERVQFQQEQMLAELKDLVDKDLFTKAETKEIMKKRTAFERALVRRVAKKADFLRYAAYEMNLEQLRRKRVERLRRFKADVGLWVQYIEVAKREGAHTLVGRVAARAIQMHPTVPALYVLAAGHELEGGSPSAARALLQRGLRLCGDSVELWREWVRMELGFIESLRRRWGVLGLEQKGKEREHEAGDGEEARAAILRGGIAKSVIASAAQALGTMELFDALIALLHTFPLTDGEGLADELLEQVYGLLRTTRPRDPLAARVLADRFLGKEVDVSGVQAANEEMIRLCGDGGEEMFGAYVSFAAALGNRVMDDSLRLYLVSSLRRLIAQYPNSVNLREGLLKF